MTDTDNAVEDLFVVDSSVASPFTKTLDLGIDRDEVLGQFAFMLEKTDGTNSVRSFKADDLTTARKSADRRLKRSKSEQARLLQLEGVLKDGRKIYRERSVLRKQRDQDVRKGFLSGSPDAGLHAHGLNRQNLTTFEDGLHQHLFLLPDGSAIFTEEDGRHLHTLDSEGEDVSNAGAATHRHRVNLPSGATSFTEEGGEHEHELMLETTGFDGGHTHALILPNGDRLRSMTISDFWEQFGPFAPAEDLPPASWFTETIKRRKDAHDLAALAPPITAEELMSKEYEVEMDDSQALALALLGVDIQKQTGDDDNDDAPRRANKRAYRSKMIQVKKIHADKQIVYGVILEEGEATENGLFTDDLAGDFVLADDVEKAAFRYMEKGSLVIKERHDKEIPVTLVENLVVRPGDIYNGVEFNKTAWIAGVHIPSTELWDQIKTGELNSFSMGGFGLRKEI